MGMGYVTGTTPGLGAQWGVAQVSVWCLHPREADDVSQLRHGGGDKRCQAEEPG